MKVSLLLSTLAVLLLSDGTYAKYGPRSLSYMARTADLIVVGEIVELAEYTFTLEVERVVAGQHKNARIVVKQFRTRSCGRRWAIYAQGQRVLLFLEHVGLSDGKGGQSPWKIMSGGDEGELPVRDGKVYVHNPLHAKWREFSRDKIRSFQLYGAELRAVEFSLATFLSAVSGLRACFASVDNDTVGWTMKQTCNDADLKRYRDQSDLHEFLATNNLDIIARTKVKPQSQ